MDSLSVVAAELTARSGGECKPVSPSIAIIETPEFTIVVGGTHNSEAVAEFAKSDHVNKDKKRAIYFFDDRPGERRRAAIEHDGIAVLYHECHSKRLFDLATRRPDGHFIFDDIKTVISQGPIIPFDVDPDITLMHPLDMLCSVKHCVRKLGMLRQMFILACKAFQHDLAKMVATQHTKEQESILSIIGDIEESNDKKILAQAITEDLLTFKEGALLICEDLRRAVKQWWKENGGKEDDKKESTQALYLHLVKTELETRGIFKSNGIYGTEWHDVTLSDPPKPSKFRLENPLDDPIDERC